MEGHSKQRAGGWGQVGEGKEERVEMAGWIGLGEDSIPGSSVEGSIRSRGHGAWRRTALVRSHLRRACSDNQIVISEIPNSLTEN